MKLVRAAGNPFVARDLRKYVVARLCKRRVTDGDCVCPSSIILSNSSISCVVGSAITLP